VVAWTLMVGGGELLRRGRGCKLLQLVVVTASLTARSEALGFGGSGLRAAIHGKRAAGGGVGNLHVRGT
jgi:hypothetical protein